MPVLPAHCRTRLSPKSVVAPQAELFSWGITALDLPVLMSSLIRL